MKRSVANQLALSIFGFAALMLAGPAVSAEIQCKTFDDAYNNLYNLSDSPGKSKGNTNEYAISILKLIYKSVNELDADQRNEVRKVMNEFSDNRTEFIIFPMVINQFCLTAGGDSLLRSAVVKSANQYQERHRR